MKHLTIRSASSRPQGLKHDDQSCPSTERWFLLLSFLLLMPLTACEQASLTASATDYTEVDKLATNVYSQVIESLHDGAYAAQIDTGFKINPKTFASALNASISDGNFAMGNMVYHDVVGSDHARNLQENLRRLGTQFDNMSDLFESVHLSSERGVTAKDIQEYFHFTADFLAAGGFTDRAANVYAAWGYAKLISITRTGIFIAKLPKLDSGGVGDSLGLLDASGGQNGGGAAAANGSTTFTATTYANGANSCADYKDPGVSAAANCISPADGSPLWPTVCTPQKGADPSCGNAFCGKQVQLSANGRSMTATICGACPRYHQENSDKADNPCASGSDIDMTDSVYNGLGYSGSNQRQSATNPGSLTTAGTPY